MQCLGHVSEDTEEGRECGLFVGGEASSLPWGGRKSHREEEQWIEQSCGWG